MILDVERVRPMVRLALEEDIGTGDITTKHTIPESLQAKAVIRAGKPGIICGLDVARLVFEAVNLELDLVIKHSEGDPVPAGADVLIVTGNARSILAAERVALNFLNALSGVATLTRSYVDKVQGLPVKILDTRKTIPGWRYLQKYAVKIGGGHNHRMGLYDQILIKDNHLALAGGIRTALQRVDSADVPIEVECTTLQEVSEALTFEPDWILLDNMNLETLRAAVKLIAGRCQTEASGGVRAENVRDVALCGVNAISIGALTHSCGFNTLDLSLDIIPLTE